MTRELRGSETVEENFFAKQIIDASAQHILNEISAGRYGKADKKIKVRHNSSMIVATGEVKGSDSLSGYYISTDRSFGPRVYFYRDIAPVVEEAGVINDTYTDPETGKTIYRTTYPDDYESSGAKAEEDTDNVSIEPSDKKLMLDNDLSINGLLVCKDSSANGLITNDQIQKTIGLLKLSKNQSQLGVRYECKSLSGVDYSSNGISNETNVLIIKNIKDKSDKDIGINVVIDFGFATTVDKMLADVDAFESQALAEESLKEGALISEGFKVPRANAVIISVLNTDGSRLIVEDTEEFETKLVKVIEILKRFIELISQGLSSGIVWIDFEEKDVSQLIKYQNGEHSDYAWLGNSAIYNQGDGYEDDDMDYEN